MALALSYIVCYSIKSLLLHSSTVTDSVCVCVCVCVVCRLLEILAHRIVEIHDYEKPVSELYTQKIYRIEVRRCLQCHVHSQ